MYLYFRICHVLVYGRVLFFSGNTAEWLKEKREPRATERLFINISPFCRRGSKCVKAHPHDLCIRFFIYRDCCCLTRSSGWRSVTWRVAERDCAPFGSGGVYWCLFFCQLRCTLHAHTSWRCLSWQSSSHFQQAQMQCELYCTGKEIYTVPVSMQLRPHPPPPSFSCVMKKDEFWPAGLASSHTDTQTHTHTNTHIQQPFRCRM